MLERKIDRIIDRHFENSRSALLLTGARQTGKTFSGTSASTIPIANCLSTKYSIFCPRN